MYTQGLDQQGQSAPRPGGIEDPAKLEAFQKRVDAEEKIEAKDWMPEAYRRTLIRQISQHAHSEIIGMQPEGNWLTRAPTLKRKAILLAKVQDEAGHGLYLYGAAETLGVSRDQMVADLLEHLQLSDAELGGHGCRRLACRRRRDHEPDTALSLFLWALRSRDGSYLQGREFSPAAGFRNHARNEPRNGAAKSHGTGCAEPVLVAVADDVRTGRQGFETLGAIKHSAQSMAWKIKRFTNDELRQKFIDVTVPQAEFLGLTVPDDALRFDEESGHYEHGEIDWQEFYDVLAGNGPCNKQRLEKRRKAQDDGAWVREAAQAYAEKHYGIAVGARRAGE